MSVIYALWLRELKRYWRSKTRIAASLAQPLLYLLVLGFGLKPVYRQAGAGDFVQFIAPGVIAMSVLTSGIFSGVSLLWDRMFGFLKETLVAPVPRIQVMIGRTLGSVTVALLQGLLVAMVCVAVGFRPVSLTMVPAGFVVLVLIAIIFAALGTTIGSSMKDMQGYTAIMNLLVLPLLFLSGMLYPLDNLPPLLAIVTNMDPLSYGVDGLRAALIARTHFGAVLDLAVLSVAAAILVLVGMWRFLKIEV